MKIETGDVTESALAAALIEAREAGGIVSPEKLPTTDPSMKEALGIQREVVRATGPVGGFKVANKPGADRIMAPIFAKDILPSPAVLTVPADEQIGIELEIGFRIDAPLPGPGAANRRQAMADCLSLVPVIEIVRTRLPGGAAPMLKLADNQINGGLVVGSPVKDWLGMSVAQVTAALTAGDTVLLEGAAQVPGGDAFENFLVLEAMIGDHCGGLCPGQVVITSSLNGLPYVQAETTVRGRIDGLGSVSLDLEIQR